MFNESPIRIQGIGNKVDIPTSTIPGFNLLNRNQTDAIYEFTVKNDSIATVNNETQQITAVKKGKTQLYAEDKSSGEKSSVDVYVLANEDLTFPQIENTQYSTLTLKANGEVWGYGRNNYGQLGTGDTANKVLPTYTGINNIVQISLGTTHALAVDAEGHVWAWGSNTYGQLGNGTKNTSYTKVQVKSTDGNAVLENIVAVSAGKDFSLALDKNGQVYAWGLNNNGQLGIGNKTNCMLPVQVQSLDNIIKIEAGRLSSFAINNENNLFVAGNNECGNLGDGTTTTRLQFTRNPLLINVQEVSAGENDNTLVLLKDGTVWGFGNNTGNCLTNVSGSIPGQIKTETGILQNVTAIKAGYQTGYAITSEEKVVGWGKNNYYQLGAQNTANRTVATYIKDQDGNDFTDVMLVSGGVYSTEIAKNDGTVWCVGYNGYGELGNGSLTNLSKIESISNPYITLEERETVLKLSNPNYQINPITTYGFNLYYDRAENSGFTYKSLNEDIAEVDENTGKVIAKSEGRAYVIVTSKSGGNDNRVTIDVVPENNKVAEKVVAGYTHSLALKQNGTVWAWGDNSKGEIGNGVANSVKIIEPLQIDLDNIVDIAAGYYYNLALDSTGDVYSWGYNGYGSLGDGTTQSKNIPTKIESLSNIKKIYISNKTSMAINDNGEIYIWGQGYSEQPQKINFYGKAIQVTRELILAENGTVWYLSDNPSKINGLSNIVQIASEDNYNIALDSKGNVYGWGYNGFGQLGQGVYSSTPSGIVKLPVENVVEIDTGNDNVVLTTNEGKVYSCGYNAYGQLGVGNSQTRILIPEVAVGIENNKLISSNTFHSVISDKLGFVYATGLNSYGQLGNSTLINQNTYSAIGNTYIYLKENVINVEINEQKQIEASLNNKFNLINDVVDSGNMEYQSLNTNIATVSENGLITGKQIGKAEILVKHTITNKTVSVFVNVVAVGKMAVPEVEASDTHMVALKADGTVWTWGNNGSGQLGTGNRNSSATPVQVTALENIIDISIGYNNTFAVKDDGTVWGFGYNGYGNLGDGTTSERVLPVQVLREDGIALENIVKVSAGMKRTVALDVEGNVWVWGKDYAKAARKLQTLANIVDISENYAVDQNGKVYKIADASQLEVENVIKISESYSHIVLLRNDGKAYSFGDNSKGELGIGNTKNVDVPTLIKNASGTDDLQNILEIKAGKEFSMALLKDKTVYIWGSNSNYKLTTMQETNQVLPKQNEKINALAIEAGVENGAYIDNDGFVYTWGLGTYGNIGNKLYNTTATPTLVGREEVVLDTNNIYLHVGEKHTIEVSNKTFNVLRDIEDTSVNKYESANSKIASVNNNGEVVANKEGKTTIVVTKEGTNYSRIAQVTVLANEVEIEPMALTVGSHTVILKADGTVWSYGVNSSYELGDGTTTSSDMPVKVKFPEGITIKQIAIGNSHNLALDTDGNVWGWGANSNNALGVTAKTPVKLKLSNIKKIAANNDQSMALTNDGYVYVWGLNNNGELGTRTYEAVKEPTLLPYVNNILDISLGKNHSLLLTTNGKVLTTGLNAYGQTGKAEGKSNTFEELNLNSLIGRISAGDNHSVLLTVKGEVYTFGLNSKGQLGLGNNENVTIPTKVKNINNIMMVSAGKSQTLLLDEDRNIYSTGSNEQGELGIGTNENSNTFTKITSINDFIAISAGNTYNVAIRYDGDVYGWGDYYHGLQNIKTMTNSRIPVKIGNDHSYVNEQEMTININNEKQINVTPKYLFNVYKENEIFNDFEYSTINSEIATVDETGKVKGIAVGTTWAKVTQKDTMEESTVIVRVIEENQKKAPQVSGGESFATVLKADGSIWSFGYNSDGQLGNDKLVPINIPSATNILSSYEKVVTGKSFTIALREDGTVWAWGDNTYGVLGQGNRQFAKKPIQVQGITDVVDISAGHNHVIALDKFGNIYTWGLNNCGQLGNGETKTITIPKKINSLENKIVSINANKNSTAVIDSEGKVYVFGKNESGNYSLPKEVKGLTKVVKASCLENAILVLNNDNTVQKITNYTSTGEIAVEDLAVSGIVDISVANDSVVLLDKNGNMYTYGANENGQAGIGTKGSNASVKQIQTIETKYFAIGAGYKDNYVIDVNGYVYSAGSNEYGQLGNSLYEDSSVFTLVGDRNFTILPEAKTMKQPEEETVTIEANIFNVFDKNERKLTDYIWKSSNEDVATVEDGVITAEDMGETTITAIDKITGATATALRVVQPLDEQRIEAIFVNGIEAKMIGENKYSISVSPNLDGTGTLKVTTKDKTDSISIDAGETYSENGVLLEDVQLDTNPKTVKIRVKTANDKIVEYILIINVTSNNASLEKLTVDGIDATPVGTNDYEIVISDDVLKPEITAITADDLAKVSINNSAKETKQSTRTVSMEDKIKTVVPIEVVSESGNSVQYRLTIYKEDALTQLDKVTVNDVEAEKIARDTYKIIVDNTVNNSKISAVAVYPLAQVQLNNLGEEEGITTKTIATIDNQTIVKIYVTAREVEREYTLIIEKSQEESDLGLFAVVVDGKVILPVDGKYEAYVSADSEKVEIKATTIDNTKLVRIAGFDAETNVTTRKVDFNGEETTYVIEVIDAKNTANKKRYELTLKTDLTLELQEVTVNGKTATKLTANTYKFLLEPTATTEGEEVTYTYPDISTVVAKTMVESSKVEINKLGEEENITTKEIETKEDETIVTITVKGEETEKDYTLIIQRKPVDSTLALFAVIANGKVIESEEDVYNVTVNYDVTSIKVQAITENEADLVNIGTGETKVHTATEELKVDGDSSYTIKVINANDNTKAREYTLNIHVDNSHDLESVKVNDKDAIKVDENTYKIIVDYGVKTATVTATTVNELSTVQINDLGIDTHVTTKNISTDQMQTIVKIFVTANGSEKEYSLIIERSISEGLELFSLSVNGTILTPIGSTYEMYVPENTKNVVVVATTLDKNNMVSIANNPEEVHTSTKTLEVNGDTTYIISVIDPEDSSNRKEYTLNIKIPSSDNTLKMVSIGNEEFVKEATRVIGTNIYEVSISEDYSKINVNAIANNDFANVSIEDKEYVRSSSTEEIQITGKQTVVTIKVQAQNGNVEEYVLNINSQSNNNNIDKITVDGNEATLSTTEENTYEYTLDYVTDKVNIGAIAQDVKATVAINKEVEETSATYRDVEIVGKSVIVYVQVTSEDGKTKQYKLIVNTLPDNVKLLSVKVNRKDANAVPTNKYEAKVNKLDTSFELYVIPEDPKAKIQINDNAEVQGTASATISKNEEVVEVKIKVTAQDGTKEEYVLNVSNQSDDAELATLMVNGNIINRNEVDGKYYYTAEKFVTESVKVKAIANNNLSTVSINGLEETYESQEADVAIPNAINNIPIILIAEDGTYKEYTLVVNKLPNDVELQVNVTMKDDNDLDVMKTADFDENGNATIKIGNNDSVQISAIARDSLATVSMEGDLPQYARVDKEIDTTQNSKTISIEVIAQDGTQKNYTVVLEKYSNDNTLKEIQVKGIDEEDITKIDETSYKVEIPDTLDTIELTAIANDQYATLKIDEGAYGETNTTVQNIDVHENETEVTITVKAENGEEKQYKVTILKVTDLGIDSIKVDEQECVIEDDTYMAFIDAGKSEVKLDITPRNEVALVSTKMEKDSDFTTPTSSTTHTIQVPITEGKDETVLIKLQDPLDETRTKTYTVIIKEKSHEAGLELLQVNDIDSINLSSYYYAEVAMKETIAKVYAKAINKYATVEIIGTTISGTGSITENITLGTEKIISIKIRVTAQDEVTYSDYELQIERKSNDTKCTITVNNETPDEYDNNTNTYTKYVERTSEEATVTVITSSENAQIEMVGNTAKQTLSQTVDTPNEENTIEVVITAENGETETYYVRIVKKSTDASIKTIKVNNIIVEEIDGKYSSTLYDNGKDVQTALIEVVTTHEKAQVQIGEGTEWFTNIGTSEVDFKDGNRVITLTVSVQAQDSNTPAETKELEIKLVSDDVGIKSIKNVDELVKDYNAETGTFTEYVDPDTKTVTLVVEANSIYTELSTSTATGTGILSIENIDMEEKEEEIIKFVATAETGRTKEYTIVIRKKSSNANAMHIYVDGVDIIEKFEYNSSVPTCQMSIEKLKENAKIRVVSENEFATIRIGDETSSVNDITKDVALDLETNSITVPIVITAQDGVVIKTYNVIFVRISNNTKIAWLEINDKHIIENEDGNYETTVKASESVAKIEVILDDILAKVSLGGEEKVGSIEETTIIAETGDTVKTITVRAQDGSTAEHKIIIHKVENDLVLDKVYLNDRIATKVDENTYKIDVEKGTTEATIKAIAKNNAEYVSINSNTRTISSNTYEKCNITKGEAEIVVTALFNGEVDQEKQYKLIINEIDEDAVLEDLRVTIEVDGETVIPESDGIYIKVVNPELDNSMVKATVNSETSQVKIKDINGETAFSNPDAQKNISLKDDTTPVTVEVVNGAGDKKQYDLYIVKENEELDDAGLKQLFADDVEIFASEDGTYNIEIEKETPKVELKAIANYSLARVSIAGNEFTRGQNVNAINIGMEDKKTIKIDVISVLGTVKQYVVNIIKEQDEYDLDSIYVDERIASKVSETEYEIDVEKGTEYIDIKAISAKETSYVQVLDNTPKLNTDTYSKYELKNGNTVEIKVYNSKQDNAKTYTLTIKEKEGTLDDLEVTVKVDGKTLSLDTDGNYIAVVDSEKTMANVWAGVNSTTSQINIIENKTGDETGYTNISITKDIALEEETTQLTIRVINGAKEEKEYTLYIVKNGSNMSDTSLESLFADEVLVEPLEDGTYSVEIPRTSDKVELVATATQETAKVSIDGNKETRHSNTQTVSIGELDSKTIKIRVTSIDGNSKEYIVEIHKEHQELDLKAVYVDGRSATKTGEKEYTIDVERTTSNVDIKAESYIVTKYVSIEDNLPTVGENTYEKYPITEDTEEVQIKVLNEEQNAYEIYTLIINKTNNVLEDLTPVIKIDGTKISPYSENDGIYIAVVSSNKDNAVLWAGVNSTTSKVKTNKTDYDNPSVTENLELTELETKRTVTVLNGEGTTKDYEVVVIKENSEIYNAELLQVIAGEGATTKGEVTAEEDKTYSVEIERTATSLKLTATSEYEYSMVSIDGSEYTLNTNTSEISIKPEEREKSIIIRVKSVSGIVKNYIVNIYRDPEELELKAVYVDGRNATKVTDTSYTIDVLESKENIDIKAVLYNLKDEYVSINGNTPTIGTNVYENYKLEDENNIIIKVTNGLDETAEDYKEKEYTLTITKVKKIEDLSDLQAVIKVNNTEVTENEEGIYEYRASETENTALVSVQANSRLTNVKINTSEYTVSYAEETISLDKVITLVDVYLQNQAGDTVHKVVKIVKGYIISGNVITEAIDQEKQSAIIKVYNTNDTREENDEVDPREVIEEITINPNGKYSIALEKGTYDIVITKLGYLEYRLTNIELTEDIKLEDINIYAGDLDDSKEIELDDMVALNDKFGTIITDDNKEETVKYDLNEDGVIDKLDRDILKKNYGKKAQRRRWVNPNEENMILPLEGSYVITSEYGTRVHPITGETKKHSGIDIVGAHHGNILAVASGEVTYAGVQSGYGNCVEIKHTVNGKTIYSFYAHLSQINVTVGQTITQGEVIGLEGGSKDDPNHGTSTGHHLHFEIRTDTGYGNSIDPTQYINF